MSDGHMMSWDDIDMILSANLPIKFRMPKM